MAETENQADNGGTGSDDLTAEARDALSKLEDLDRVLPRSIEDWVAERERDGLDVPAILKQRLKEKDRLRSVYRAGGGE